LYKLKDKDLVSVFYWKKTRYAYPVFPEPFVEEAIFSPVDMFDTLVENWMAVAVWFCFCMLFSIPLICVSIFVPIPFVYAMTL
jgi:hypothetical protein